MFDCYKVIPKNKFLNLFVGYNLRHHPALQYLKMIFVDQSVLSVQAYAGQYLPNWRQNTDYRNSYSASRVSGGGVIRDLSHELDFLTWLFGGWTKVSAIGGHFSQLEIDSDDIFTLMFTTNLCPVVNLQLNYLDRLIRRFVIINTAQHTIELDLVKGCVTVDQDRKFFTVDRDYTYMQMHKDILTMRSESLCSIGEGLDVIKLIEAAELASVRMEWISRD